MIGVALGIGKQDSWNIYYSCGSVRCTSMTCLRMFIFLTPVIKDGESVAFLYSVRSLNTPKLNVGVSKTHMSS